ncbi:Short C-terminal domain-containing protein [Natronorubrum sediminis]|uniref:Short C-terminal domain-containing protein n=1 Tax=Natronorubrum sediminis TaxID=640943 RepID=A0A1H6FZZ9_9EURY|nr:SHOCT domain-containing protein [Natronorubrum sediminis]SEH15972.1 Short C-terminal domain-containing protein [Natronorubrum sediminis]
MSDDPATRIRENITEITSMVVTALWLGLMFAGVGGNLWLVVLLVGYVAVVPLVALLFGDEADKAEWWDGWWGSESRDEREREESDSSDAPEAADRHTALETTPKQDNREALETLRTRYAAGELTDEQFERKLERLLETETLEDVEQWRGSTTEPPDRTGAGDRDEGTTQDRDFEYET